MSRVILRRRRIESTLQLLVEILIDSQEGLVTIGERLSDLALRRYFLAESIRRGQFIDELKEMLERLGLEISRDSGSAVGALHRAWARIKSQFNESDYALLVTAEHGERTITMLYEEIVRAHLPVCIRKVIVPQAKRVRMTHRYVTFARDRALIDLARLKQQRAIAPGSYGIDSA